MNVVLRCKQTAVAEPRSGRSMRRRGGQLITRSRASYAAATSCGYGTRDGAQGHH